MSETTQRISIYVNGVLTDPTSNSVVASDSSGTYGIQSVVDFEDMVAVDDPYTRESAGIYTIAFDETEDDLTYRWAAKLTYSSTVYYLSGEMPSGDTYTTVILPNTSTHFTSQAEVLRIIGSLGSQILLEDDSSNYNVWNDILQDADDTINMYIGQHYNPALLYSNGWVRRRATKLVANLLTSRRGNPPLYTSAIDRVYEELQMIRDGKMHIPGARPRFFQGPLVRNYLMQPASLRHPLRVEQDKSTSSGTYGEDFAIEPYVYNGAVL